MFASLLVLTMSASRILPTDYLEVGAVVLTVAEHDVLVLAVRGSFLEGNAVEAVAAPMLRVENNIGVFIRPHLYSLYFAVCRSQDLARADVGRLA